MVDRVCIKLPSTNQNACLTTLDVLEIEPATPGSRGAPLGADHDVIAGLVPVVVAHVDVAPLPVFLDAEVLTVQQHEAAWWRGGGGGEREGDGEREGEREGEGGRGREGEGE